MKLQTLTIKVGSNHTCLAVITIDSALKKDENCYLQAFSKRVRTDWQRKIKDYTNYC